MTQTAIDVCRKQSESRKRAGAYGGELEGHGRSDMELGPIGGELEGHGRSDMGLGPMRGVRGSWRKRHGAGAYQWGAGGSWKKRYGAGAGAVVCRLVATGTLALGTCLVPLSFMSSAVRWGIEDLLLRVVMRIKQGNLCQGFFDQYLTQSKSSERKSGGVVIKS